VPIIAKADRKTRLVTGMPPVIYRYVSIIPLFFVTLSLNYVCCFKVSAFQRPLFCNHGVVVDSLAPHEGGSSVAVEGLVCSKEDLGIWLHHSN